MQSTWWLASLGRLLVWARLDVRDSGGAQVFDCDGNLLTYDSEDSARAALLDADFLAFDGIDADDAVRMGFALGEVSPPDAANDEQLKACMIQPLRTDH
jgi:hypothetical protein